MFDRKLLRVPLTLSLLAAGACASKTQPVEVVPTSTTPLLSYDADGCAGPGCAGGLVDGEFEYVIVGAGAGGGPLAARLARAGHKVLLLDAGGDPGDRLTYQIPAWHVLASEDAAMRWDYFVSHYDDPAQAKRDDKLLRDGAGNPIGVWYPRGSGVGGSTTLNALIAVTPHASDWDRIADTVAAEDPSGSWKAAAMRQYFVRAENNGYVPSGTAGHGFAGWMHTSVFLDKFFDYVMAALDWKMLRVIIATVVQTSHELGVDLPFDPLHDVKSLLGYVGSDLNAGDAGRDGRQGVIRVPQQVLDGRRNGVRELIVDTINAGYPLTLKTHALATRVLFDRSGAKPKATGVEFLDGANLYQASPAPLAASATPQQLHVTGEVILAAGAFNTPQLLMLSGIGPRAQLEGKGITTLIDLPGVGANLQDRYEFGVIGEMSSVFGDQFTLLKDCSFNAAATPAQLDASDPCYVLWKHNVGVYTINGNAVGIVRRSDPTLADPDLFIFGLPGYFRGYYPGYSADAFGGRRYFTWVVLKAHSGNTHGTVSLASADPHVRPDIHFRSFDENGDADLKALVDGVELARRIVAKTQSISPFTDHFSEVYPGPEIAGRDQLGQFIKDKAWGHHACCTAKIGASSDPTAVLDSRFRVRGTDGLRVVDASVFPRIPGYFLAVPIYMISEKAADVIHQDSLAK
jgi:choline dehydrogenase